MPKYNLAQTGDHLRVLDNLKVMPWHVEGGFQRVSSSSTLTVSSRDFETTCIYYWFQACLLVVKVLYHSLLEYIQRRLQTLIKATKFQNDHESNCNKHQN